MVDTSNKDNKEKSSAENLENASSLAEAEHDGELAPAKVLPKTNAHTHEESVPLRLWVNPLPVNRGLSSQSKTPQQRAATDHGRPPESPPSLFPCLVSSLPPENATRPPRTTGLTKRTNS